MNQKEIIKEIDRQIEAMRKSQLEIQENFRNSKELKKENCADCGHKMTGFFSQFFTVCSRCWDKRLKQRIQDNDTRTTL
jgi:hypothetical protein